MIFLHNFYQKNCKISKKISKRCFNNSESHSKGDVALLLVENTNIDTGQRLFRRHIAAEGFKKGERGEEELIYFLTNNSSIIKRVIDVRKNPYYQRKDIDFLLVIKDKNGKDKAIPIEIKADYHEYTGNIFCETISNDKKNTPGCFMYSEAKILFYYFPNIKQIYMFDLELVRDWFVKNEKRFPRREVKNYNEKGKYIFSAWGRLINKEYLKRNCPLHIINLNDDFTVKNIETYPKENTRVKQYI